MRIPPSSRCSLRVALWTEEGRAGVTVESRQLQWMGAWAGASMIRLEYRMIFPDRPLTPEEKAIILSHRRKLAEQGYDVSLEVPDNAGGASPWDNALMVRTADGTWRMSYRSFCRRMDTTINLTVDFRCPDDPTPHFPDSDLYDRGIMPPNMVLYYLDPRDTGKHFENNEGFRHDNLGSRTTEGYLGVPPS